MLTEHEKNLIREHYQTLSNRLPNFRPRKAQRQMLAELANAFSRAIDIKLNADEAPQHKGESIIVIEGPTGVGKSLAYLIAGVIMAQERGKKLVISSATIALQEQLVNRDLPFLLKYSDLSFAYALAKGRRRYLCPYRLYQFTADASQGELLGIDSSVALWEKKPEASEIAILQELADAFFNRKWNGDVDTWTQRIDSTLWARVSNDRHGCLRSACINRPECPFFLARETLEKVDVVVTNHDLLLADSAMGGGVILPAQAASFYCIDEAHHLSKKAINQFAAEHSLNQALFCLDKIPALVASLQTFFASEQRANECIESSIAALETLNEWQLLLEDQTELAMNSETSEPIWLFEDGKLPEQLKLPTSNMALSVRMLFKHLSSLSDSLAEVRKEKPTDNSSIDKLSSDLGFLLARVEQIHTLWDLFETLTPEGQMPIAKWIARSTSGKGDYRFCASPVSAAESLASTLWQNVSGALLTSATLRSLGSFDLLLKQTGLARFSEVTCLTLNSPFDFSKQGELYLPALIASPKDAEAHTKEIIEWLPKLINADEGVGTLVLFSSRKQMQDVALNLPAPLNECLQIQGESSKSRLLEEHAERLKQNKASVIFGLDSFAEGLDLPGDSCVQVIIARLPFSMPDNPVDQTLSRWVEKQGGNPFFDITLPEASIKLIQAVGRLIRSETDYGRISILDNRISKQSYGKKLLAALPPFRRIS